MSSIRSVYGFLRADVHSLGVLPQMLCKELKIPSFFLIGLNPVYKNSFLIKNLKTGGSKVLIPWIEFIKIMSILIFKTGSDCDTIHFILKVEN